MINFILGMFFMDIIYPFCGNLIKCISSIFEYIVRKYDEEEKPRKAKIGF